MEIEHMKRSFFLFLFFFLIYFWNSSSKWYGHSLGWQSPAALTKRICPCWVRRLMLRTSVESSVKAILLMSSYVLFFFWTEYRNQISIATNLRTIWVYLDVFYTRTFLYKDIFSWRWYVLFLLSRIRFLVDERIVLVQENKNFHLQKKIVPNSRWKIPYQEKFSSFVQYTKTKSQQEQIEIY